MFLDGPKGPERTEPAWENVTTISEAVGKGQVQPVSMCDKCPPAVRSMLAGKEETAAAEKKHMAQLQQASAAADAGRLSARPVHQGSTVR